jgi:uncharacterized protein
MNDREAELRGTAKEIIYRYLPKDQYKVFLFGSRAKGTNRDRSDFDIAIEGIASIPGHVKLAIGDALDKIPTLYSFDVVDMKTAGAKFRESIAKNIVAL